MTTLWFGKHKGEDIEDVPTDYLRWIVENCDAPPKGDPRRESHLNLISDIESELESREKYGEKDG